MTSRYRASAGATSVLALLLGVVPGAPAEADCLHADVYVERQNESTIYPVGEDPCLTPTSGTWMLFVGPVDVGHDVPDGAPRRVFVDIRVPVP